jgi:hypothetical protein
MPTREKLTIVSIVNIVLLIAGLTCITVGCIKLITGDISLASTGLGAGLLLLFSATIDRFESLKGMSLEVTTRRLDAKISEADSVVRELKQLAEISGHTLSLLAAKVGRWGGAFSFDESFSLAQQVRENLSSLKSDSKSIAHALQPWVNVILSDLSRKLLTPIQTELRDLERSLQSERSAIKHPIASDDKTFLDLTKRINALSQHLSSNNEPSLLPNEDIYEGVKSYISSAPEIPCSRKEIHLRNVKPWATEVEYLLNENNVKNATMWSEALKHEG